MSNSNSAASASKDNLSGEKGVVIVIGREYGSGGRRIGKMLAKSLNIPYYDKTLLSEAARSLGYAPEIFERTDERRPSLMRSLLSFTYGAHGSDYNASSLSDERIYQFQSNVIRDICDRGSCVIVGRTADYVMREHPGLLSIFIHAPLSMRARHIMERENISNEEDARNLAVKKDHEREAYYNYYTNRNWGRCSNYHISLDSSKLSDDAILSLVKSILSIDSPTNK